MAGLLYRLGAFSARHKLLVIAVWALVIVVAGGARLYYGAPTTNSITLPGTGSQRTSDLLAREFPSQRNAPSPLVFHVAKGRLTDPADKRAIEAALASLARQPAVSRIQSPFGAAAAELLSKDGRTAMAQVFLKVNGLQLTKSLAERVFAAAAPARHAGIQVEAGGALGAAISAQSSRRSEEIGIAAAVVILALTFGALVAASMPIVSAVVGLVVGLSLVGLFGHVINIPTVGPILATMIGLGVGIDYALFIVFRFRDELHRGVPVDESVARALATSGSAVVFAGATVIVSLLALLVANVPLIGSMGFAAALTVLVAIVTSLTLLPAVLALLGRRIDAVRLPWRRRTAAGAPDKHGFAARWAGLVTRHPWTALVAALLVLAPLVAPTFTLILGQEDIGVTPTSTTQRRAFDLISAGFGPGANGPLLVAMKLSPPAQPSAAYTNDHSAALRLAKQLKAGKRRLTKGAAALKREGAALAAQQSSLTAQAGALQSRQSSLQAQGAMLQSRQAALLGDQERLLAEQRRLTAKGKALAAQGAALQAQIAQVQQQLAAATDPTVIAQLQAQLATLAAKAQQVQAQVAAVKRQGTALARQGAKLKQEGGALAAAAATLQQQGATLSAQATRLAAAGSTLKARGAALAKQSAALKREGRVLKRKAARAKTLKAELTRMLTQAGGQPGGTDPRLVRLEDALARTPGVAEVSPVQVNKSGTAAILSVNATTRPADPRTAALVKRLRDSVIPAATRGSGVTALVGGVTAAYVDLASIISARLPLVIGTVLALSFVILLIAFHSLWVPIKAVLLNLLAVGASFGLLTAWFQWGWGLRLTGLQNPYGTVPIASYVPLIMFAVLFGLSMDYEVFLVSQIFHAHTAGESPRDSIRSGVSSTARVITAAAVIMVSVFASFILHGDPVIKQFGVGLSFAIILDATIVRLVIVPASMALVGRWNWWLPRWLRWLPQVDLPEESAAAGAATPAASGAEDSAAAKAANRVA